MFVARPAPNTARRSFDTRDASARVAWRVRCCGDVWPNTCCGKLREIGRPEAGCSPFGGRNGCYVARTDNYGQFFYNKERLVSMVNDITEELLDRGTW